MKITAEKTPPYMGVTEIICTYSINYPPDRSYVKDWVARGHFTAIKDKWEIVSGDSSWADTVQSFVSVDHKITVRALERGKQGIDAQVIAPLGLHDNSYLEERATIVLDIK